MFHSLVTIDKKVLLSVITLNSYSLELSEAIPFLRPSKLIDVMYISLNVLFHFLAVFLLISDSKIDHILLQLNVIVGLSFNDKIPQFCRIKDKK